MENIALQSLQIFSLLCYAQKLLPLSGQKMVAISARNTAMRKFANFNCKAIFSTFYKISRPNFEILLLLKGSSREFRSLCLDLPRSEISL